MTTTTIVQRTGVVILGVLLLATVAAGPAAGAAPDADAQAADEANEAGVATAASCTPWVTAPLVVGAVSVVGCADAGASAGLDGASANTHAGTIVVADTDETVPVWLWAGQDEDVNVDLTEPSVDATSETCAGENNAVGTSECVVVSA